MMLSTCAKSRRLTDAIERVTANSDFHTPDLGGQATTVMVTGAVIEARSTAITLNHTRAMLA
jgi:isocitrate/isopropylmalate dehydrogenase